MISQNDPETFAAPSLSRLARTTAIALGAAVIILVTIVLPAEYAIDPLGTGRRLGLTEIASPSLNTVDATNQQGAMLTPTQKGPLGEYPAEFHLDLFETVLQPYDYVEYKYHLEKGAAMLYSWTASAPLVQDFHGERAKGASDGPEEESFDKQDRRQASGSLIAPFSGIHGWYWENPGAAAITIRLTSSGYYSSALEIRSDRSRHPHRLRSLKTMWPLEPESGGAENSRQPGN